MEKLSIKTHLVGKNELMRLMMLAKATRNPLLLIGQKGVAKTDACREFSRSLMSHEAGTDMSHEECLMSDQTFTLETNRHTRANEITGHVDIAKLVKDQEFDLVTPMATAKYILINEIDKSGGAVRDALLSSMAEKVLFNGEKKIPCAWEVFVATCNEIPQEEAENHFWDRFVIKYNVARISQASMLNILQQAQNDEVTINYPTLEEVDGVSLPQEKLSKMLDACYRFASDRTLTKMPRIVKAITLIWGMSINEAFVKAAELVVGRSASTSLSQLLMSKEMKVILQKVEQLKIINDQTKMDQLITEIYELTEQYVNAGLLSDDEVREITLAAQKIIEMSSDQATTAATA